MSYLSKKGYVLKKDSFSTESLNEIKKELYAKPLTDSKFTFNPNQNPNFPVYVETKNKLYIPKMYGIKKFGLPNKILDNYNGTNTENLEFTGTLYDNQIEPVNSIYDECIKNGGGILTSGTGSGKTFMALNILSKLQKKTIIVVNKIPLMEQWESEIRKFLPNATIGFIQGQKKVDVQSKDITIAMLQSLARIDYPDSLFDDYGACFFDECHNLASQSFSKILFKLCCKYTVGLSATPNRSDGCEYVFKWHIGEIVHKSNDTRIGKPPIIRLLKIDTADYKEVSSVNRFTGLKTIQFTSMLSELVEMPKRNLLIIECIKNLIKENRKILVLSDRRNHLTTLDKLLNNDTSVTFTHGLFLGSMKSVDLEKSRASDVILATFAAFGEGVSEKDLDTLILITPKKFIGHLKNTIKNESFKIEQIVGRIFRKDHIHINPVIVDFYDNFSIYKNQGNSRKVFYKEHFKNGIFEDLSINLDNNENVKYQYIVTKKSKKDNKIEEESNIKMDCLIIE